MAAGTTNPYSISYFSSQPVVANIPSEFRIYDRDFLTTKISEGRANLMRLLLAVARRKGAYIARDVETRWGIEYARLDKINMTANSTTSVAAQTNWNDVLVVSNADGARLQAGDILNLMGHWVSVTRSYLTATTGEGALTKGASTPLPEQVKVLENYGSDSYSTGNCKIRVRRNFGGLAPTGTGHANLLVDYDGSITSIGGMAPFLWKAGNSMAEGRDDQLTYSDTNTWDYNYCQIVMRKWSATETEQNVDRFYSREKTFQVNGRKALEEFYRELDVQAFFGSRRTEVEGGRQKWYFGGIAEFIPSSNHVAYTDTLFETKNFNTQLKDMFYFGSQIKLALCGADFYTKFSNMIDNKIILNGNVSGWGVNLVEFNTTNGGKLLIAPSDTLSLHGMSDYCYIIDPDHFQYGHLQNMDIKSITVPITNPHEMEGEVYGQITMKRTNPKAHWVFLKG